MTRRKRHDAPPSIRDAARQVIGVTLASFAMAATTQAAQPREHGFGGEAFTRADANHDGRLSKAEVARFPVFAEKFDQLDTDRDGALDLAEFEAGFNAPQ